MSSNKGRLVLTRDVGVALKDTLLIGDDIEIKFVETNGRQVKISIDAPRSVSVDRAEVRKAKESK